MGALSFTEDAFIISCVVLAALRVACLSVKGHVYWVGFFFGSVCEAG